jgi:polar amino acid transport system permease protein
MAYTPKPDSLPDDVDVADAKPRIMPWRIVGTVVLVLVLLQLVYWIATNPRFEWSVVGQYLFFPTVLAGLGMTLFLTVVCMALGSLLGIAVAAGQLSNFRPVRWFCQGYVGLFRGVPPLVQLIFWFNLAYLVPVIGIGVPWAAPIVSWSANDLIVPLTAAIIGLSLHESAYMAEITRAGILSVDQGQTDASKAMGFSSAQTFWKVILPQAMRIIVPPAGSQFIALLKGTSLVSVITLTDLLYSVQVIYSRTYQVVPMLLVAVIWYLVVVTVLTMIQRRLERRFGRGYDRPTKATRRELAKVTAEATA